MYTSIIRISLKVGFTIQSCFYPPGAYEFEVDRAPLPALGAGKKLFVVAWRLRLETGELVELSSDEAAQVAGLP